MSRSLHHRMALAAVLVALLFGGLPGQSLAQDELCFRETSFCIRGEIRAFWEKNGGLPIFGYPIGLEEDTVVEGQRYRAQRFERNRLELHPENAPPYNVLLGRLAAESLERQGRDWTTFPAADPGSPHYFPQTRHAIAPEFWEYWSSYGLEFDGLPGVSFNESLALFGLPLSEATMEVNPTNGQTYLTQHFERARFELHPELAPDSVLLGLMGSELGPSPDENPSCSPDEPPTGRPNFSDPAAQDWPDGGIAFVSSGTFQNDHEQPFVITVTGRREDAVAAYIADVRVCLAITELDAAGPEAIISDRLVAAEILADQDTENLRIEIELEPDFAARLEREISLLFVIDPTMGANVIHHYPAKYRGSSASTTISVSGGRVTGNLYKDCDDPSSKTIAQGTKNTISRGGRGWFDLTVTGLDGVNKYSLTAGMWSNIEHSTGGSVTC